ncbi:PDZ domain-containing protein [Caldalkalibacillus horti]|uniref:PDZ domain-containing protein n=1 Tax=Caldalkalibacillus horti TaxID=77523 RepID=A0ABT9VWR4_9BACI|nr:PDZ domain-containing protein [Bacillus horti]MDQ0165442.1 PDZ domain-containing protein [Bacillus horti]
MKMYKRLQLLGIAFYFLFILFAQLLWLFDPLRIGNNIYWIDLLDILLYVTVMIPLIWWLASITGLYTIWRRRKFREKRTILSAIHILIKIGVLVCSFISIYYICFKTGDLVGIGVILTITCVLVVLDTLIVDFTIYHRIPWKGWMRAIVVLALGVILLYPTAYTVTFPGLTMDMNRYAQVVDTNPQGEIMGVLVFSRPATPIDWLYAQIFPYYDIEPRRRTDQTLTEQLERVLDMKVNANRVASTIAFQQAGLGNGFTSNGALITALVPGSPAANLLQVGDKIINLNGYGVSSVEEFQELMAITTPGMDVQLTIVRSAEEIVFVTTTQYLPEDQDTAVLGVSIIDDIVYDIPNEVLYYTYLLHKGGPSHGSMLALTLFNQLSPNSIMNGNKVAGTGTIQMDGTIGRIGGIKQKAYTVERAGADVFFVPASQYEDAREGSKTLNIVPVRTLTDIIEWLEENPK